MNQNTKLNNGKVEVYDRPQDVINWIKRMSEKTEFFKNVAVIPFGNMCFVYPKDMTKEKAIKMLKKYWEIHSE